MAEWEREYFGGASGKESGAESADATNDPDDFGMMDDDDLSPVVATPAPRAPRPRKAGPRLPKSLTSGTALYVLVSLVFAMVFGAYTGLFQRAFGDPEVHGIWVSIGSVLFVLWVIGVTTYAVLRVSFWLSGIVLRAAAHFSVLAYDVLRTPLKIATYLAIAALAVFGAYALYLRMAVGAE